MSEERTDSERLFEQYLHEQGYNGWEFEPVLEGKTKRPDYLLRWKGRELLFEVKELRAKEPLPKVWAGFTNPYAGLRKKIEAARKKFKEFGEYCCSLIHCSFDWKVRPNPQFVFGAMLGDLGFTIPFDPERGIAKPGPVTSTFLGGGKMIRQKTHEAQNTTISSMVLLEEYTAKDLDFLCAYEKEVNRQETQEKREIDTVERMEIRHRLHPLFPQHTRHVPRVIVVENPVARVPLPRGLFTGPYDERWEYANGEIQRIFAGEPLLQQEEAENE